MIGFALSMVASAFDQSHSQLNGVLKKYVANKKADYAGLKKDQGALDSYLSSVAGVSKSEFKGWSDKQELAFLINVYNAATLKLVVDHYPVKSIKKIGGFKGPWKQEVVQLFGKKFTLDQIEHEMIRVDYDDPRAHFAINCASGGCPSLRSEAYRAEKLDTQLHQQGQIFFGDASKNRVDESAGRLYLSPIFEWFKEDFVKKSGSVEKFIAPFLPEAQRSAVLSGKLKIVYTDYDWKLNQK
ncbi:DUF547 domain-containing protein [Haloferula sp.]|uniref:DUF547 domain-containing protein n=1 Tax=Haloferula sp. TaxID=2497595 RepID=UPI00329CAB51